jgi:hypothetical protein
VYRFDISVYTPKQAVIRRTIRLVTISDSICMVTLALPMDRLAA